MTFSSPNGCRICGNSQDLVKYLVQERMYGLNDEFEYFQCADCKCLQIASFPDKMERFYPKNYYSMVRREPRNQGKLISQLRKWRAQLMTQGNTREEAFPWRLFKKKEFFTWFKRAGVKSNYAILDVGCGTGELLLNLRLFGYSNLTGFEAFIDEDIHYVGGPSILKRNLDDDLTKAHDDSHQYDFIMAHHSFEHMRDPKRVLTKMFALLKQDRFALIRVPVVESFAWEKYRERWAQLDAPRHFYLHSPHSMQILAERAGFVLKHVEYESGEFQFLGSELYMKDISLAEFNSYPQEKKKRLFPSEVVENFKRQSLELNAQSLGDAAAFYLYKN